VPAISKRPLNPYHEPGADIGDLRLPMVAIDHCNDCRRATGSVIPMWIAAHLPTVTVSCRSRSASSADGDGQTWRPAAEVFDHNNSANEDLFLTFYRSSEGRTRSFCGLCGTNLAYKVDTAVTQEKGWPEMLDLVLGTVDREDLEKEWFVPERQLLCGYGIAWVRKFARKGAGEVPEHLSWKINEVDIPDSLV
jgi:hypothetical protein